ncbi:minor tail protein [Arthrobacter phage JEGGS]|uniref:Minor tail protein n=1 Tax=Arthrobacter phage JEGGS TaxID=2591110 RepID=A0A515MLF2_9CAUD|nr:tail protein [Arthrobacter phage JEGGS]QDM57502.1 minor tail protein [Arthrobacter phage JEGGS]
MTYSQIPAVDENFNFPPQIALAFAQSTQLLSAIATAIANDPSVVTSAANTAQTTVGLIPVWKANTAYVAGQRAIAPNGDIVSAKVNFTSGSTYSATNWNQSQIITDLFGNSIPIFKAGPYTAGQRVVAPTGEIVSAKVDFTATATYAASNWNESSFTSSLKALIASAGYAQRELIEGEDINNIRIPGVYTCPSNTIALTLLNWPAKSANGTPVTGALIVGKSTAGAFTSQEVVSYHHTVGMPDIFVRATRAASNNTSWTNWGSLNEFKGIIPDNTNLDTFREDGTWTHSDATKLTGLPPEITSGEIVVENRVSAKTIISKQLITAYDGRSYVRVSRSTLGWAGRAYTALHGIGSSTPGGPTQLVPDSGIANRVLIDNFTQIMGGTKKVDTATVAFRFDHGLNNYDLHIRSRMAAKNWKHSLALCSAQWSRSENTAVTPSMVNDWVIAGLLEIWNHSADHGSGDNSFEQWTAAILNGLLDLQTQIPAAAGKIFGFAPPGSSGTNFGGFTNGQTLDQFVDTDGMRFILKHHAVASGYLHRYRVQDGLVRQGMGHITMDQYSLSQVQSYVNQAKSLKAGLQIMLHPSLISYGPTYVTPNTLDDIYGWIKSEETAGNIQVVSPYEQLLCDVT